MADSSEPKGKLSRRDFLKLAVITTAAAGGVGLGFKAAQEPRYSVPSTGKEIPPEWITGEIPFGSVDFVNNPDYWVGESGSLLSQKLRNQLSSKCEEIYPETRAFVQEKDSYDMGDYQAEKVTRAIDKLVLDMADRGEDIVFARENGFDSLTRDLTDRYVEVASHVQMTARLLAYKDQVGGEQFCNEMYSCVADETIGSLKYGKIEQLVDRKNIDAVWNYDWKTFSQMQTVLSPVALPFFTQDGFEYTYKPYIYSGDPGLSNDGIKPPVPSSNEWYTKRPGRVEILNYDDQVAIEIRKELAKFGIERGINSLALSYDSQYMWAATFTGPDHSAVTIYHPSEKGLTMEEYKGQERGILHVLVHEGYHSLSSRRSHLPQYDRMMIRALEQDILAGADPLLNLKTVFDPDGDDHGYDADNEHSMTRYYLENLVNTYGNMGSGAKVFLDEFRANVQMMTNEDIYSTFWLREEDKDMTGLFDRLGRDIATYDGVTKVIAQTLTDNRDAILKRRRMPHPKEYDGYYFNDVVMPLVFAHIIQYRSDELLANIKPENLETDRGLMKNYVKTFQKRFRAFVLGGPSEEFLGEIFSEAMLTEKYGAHGVDFVNKAKVKFDKILAILRKNKLARQQNTL